MEKLNIENKNLFVEKIKQLDSKYKDESMFPAGKIEEITYSDLGKTMGIKLTGDVPTNFQPAEIVIVHPESEKDGWIGKGKLGFLLGGKGVDISKIPLGEESIKNLRNIYQEYTGKELREHINMESNLNRLAIMGLYNEIVENSK